jgi:hypothetical protein
MFTLEGYRIYSNNALDTATFPGRTPVLTS